MNLLEVHDYFLNANFNSKDKEKIQENMEIIYIA
jgi:hypothetical protein